MILQRSKVQLAPPTGNICGIFKMTVVTPKYMNISIIDTLNMLIKDYVKNNEQFTRKVAIPQDKFLNLINLVLTTTWNSFNSKFYQETNGIAMEGLASSITTEI